MLRTEERNANTKHIDRMTTTEMLAVMQQENIHAAMAVDKELDAIGKAVDAISERMKKGGRLFYIGCGTSGRLGVVDASECPPTYGVPHELVVAIIAGGDGAIRRAAEFAEDSAEAGRRDLGAYDLTELDSVVGISVAGGAAYVGLELLWRGRSHGSMFLAGGSCFLLLGQLSKRGRSLSAPARATLGAGIVTAVELMTGLIFNRDHRVWDYRDLPLQFMGQICLPYSLLWIPVSAAAMGLYRRLEKLIK